jgi:hypothetical protein
VDLDRDLQLAAYNHLGRLHQADGVMTPDPFAEEAVRNPDFERITIAT